MKECERRTRCHGCGELFDPQPYAVRVSVAVTGEGITKGLYCTTQCAVSDFPRLCRTALKEPRPQEAPPQEEKP